MRTICFALSLLSLAACGGGLSTGLEGIYAVNTWTENPAGCDVEGPSVAAQNSPNFIIKVATFNFLGEINQLQVLPCADTAACTTRFNEAPGFVLGSGFYFEDGSDSAGWESKLVSASAIGSEPCMGDVADTTLTASGTDVTVRAETTLVPDVARDSEGFCDTDDAQAKAASQACNVLEVLTGSLIMELGS